MRADRRPQVATSGRIRVGIGGWTFAPWRGTFFPKGLPHTQELAYAAQRLSTIEINGTFYRTQTPATFRKWRDEVPDDFVFTIKGPRAVSMQRDLSAAAPALDRFFASGLTELGPKLGPILWQLPPTRKFDPETFGAFLALLPREHRHAIEARHDSFATPEALALLRTHNVAAALIERDGQALHGDMTAAFTYARLERNTLDAPEGYDSQALDRWAARVQGWAAGNPPADLPPLVPSADAAPRDCFIYFISGDKVRAPDAAQAFQQRLDVPR